MCVRAIAGSSRQLRSDTSARTTRSSRSVKRSPERIVGQPMRTGTLPRRRPKFPASAGSGQTRHRLRKRATDASAKHSLSIRGKHHLRGRQRSNKKLIIFHNIFHYNCYDSTSGKPARFAFMGNPIHLQITRKHRGKSFKNLSFWVGQTAGLRRADSKGEHRLDSERPPC